MTNKLMRVAVLVALFLAFWLAAVQAQEEDAAEEPQIELSPDEIVCDLDVIVQRDDWLSKLSEKFYGDVLAFPAIAEATNAKATQDETYAVIDDVDFIEIGWKLCIVNVQTAEEILDFELENAPIGNETPVNLTGVIPIGAAHALSGPFAQTGQSIRNGVDLAVSEINNTTLLDQATLQVIWEDTAGRKDQATDAFNKLINQDQVVAILGPTLSRSAFAAAPVAQQAGVPVIGSSNAASGVTDIGDYIFRTNLSESQIISNTVRQANLVLNLQQVAVLYDKSNAFTIAGYTAFVQALEAQDIEVVATIAFTDENSDVAAQLSEIEALNPNAIIISALPETAAAIIRQARQAGISQQVRFIGSSSLNSPLFLGQGGSQVNGTIVGAAWSVNTISGSNRQFTTDYEARYGSLPDQFAAQAYTAVWALATAIRSANSTERAAVRDALANLAFVDSPLGIFTFTDDRTPDHLPVVQVAENGSFVILQ